MTKTMYADLEALAVGLQDAYQKGIKAKEEGNTINDVSFAPMEPYTPSGYVIEQSRLQGIVKKFVLPINMRGCYRVLTCLTRSFFDAFEE
jgi:hypothetical protein